MPGRKDRDDKFASFMTGAVKNRADVTAADSALTDLPEIDLSTSPSAADNSIFAIPVRTAGAGTLSLELWRQLTRNNPAYTGWAQVGSAAASASETEIKFTGLVAAKYKLKATALTAGASWDVYEYHSEV
jgi:hypothetical protein